MSGKQQATGLNYIAFSFILLFVGIAVTIVQYKVPPILEPIMTQFQIGLDAGSWLMSIFTAIGIVLSLPTGTLTKALGPKKVLLIGCGFSVAGSVIGAFAGSAAVLVASRAVEGVAFVFITVAAPLAIEKFVAPENQGTANGIWALWICFGSVIGSTATPMVFQALGLAGTWLVYAAIVVVAALVLAVAVREPKQAAVEPIRSIGESGSPIAPGNTDALPAEEAKPKLADYLQLLRVQPLLYFFAYLVFNIEILAILSYTPTMLQGQGMDASLSGFAASLPGLLAAVSSPLFGKLIDKTGSTKWFYVVALAVSAPATMLMLTQAGALLWAGAALIGFIGYAIPVCTLSSLPQIAGSKQMLPTAMGMLMLVQCFGEFLGSLVTPMLLGPAGNDWMFCGIVMCAIGLAGAVALVFVRFK